MPRYKIFIGYEGTRYSGWQKQPNANTIEEEIEQALTQILQYPVNIIGQGRTDSGVHAERQIAHFDFTETLDKDSFLYAMVGVLPRDIAVWDIKEVSPGFHARFDGKARQYRYQIITRPSPLLDSYAERVFKELDTEAMAECADMITGKHCFESFTKSSAEQPDTECEVYISEFKFEEPLITYRIKANRFVRYMVRRLVGTMIQVGLGKKKVDYFTDLLRKPSNEKSGYGASAKGLILEKVEY